MILLLRAAVIALLAVGADHLLEHTAWYRHFQEAGYKSAQHALIESLTAPPDSLPVRMLDLSALVHRTQSPLVCGRPADDEQLADQWLTLARLLPDIQKARPKALFIDWELALPDNCVEITPQGLQIKETVQENAREAYQELMTALTEADKQFPVLIVAEKASQRWKKGQPLFPAPVPPNLACAPVLLRAPHLVYAGLAARQGVDGLPAAPEALLQRLGLRPPPETSRWNPLEITHWHHDLETQTEEPAYWIDYAYLPLLLKETVSVEPTALALDAKVLAELKDRILVLADVTDPHFEDVFPMPLDPEKAFVGERRLPAYTGGLGHACALLTQLNRPLYTVRGGWVWLVTLFLFNLGLLALGLLVARDVLWWNGREFCDHSDWSELIQVAVDIFMVLLSALFLVWLNGQTWWTRLLLPQYAPLLVARMLELVAVLFLIAWHLIRHKPHKAALTAEAAKSPRKEGNR